MKFGQVAVACTVLSSLAIEGADAAPAKKKGKWGSSGSGGSIDTSSMSSEPTTAYVQDLKKLGGNIPTSGSSTIDNLVGDLLSSISDQPKLYMIVGNSDELDADTIKNRLVSECGADAVSSLKEAGYDKVAESADLQDVTRQVARAVKGDNEASVRTIDAQGRPEFEQCISRVVNDAIAKTSKANRVGVSSALIGGAAIVAALTI
ncbi:MAG TPA: hypothetical protein DHW71_03025 [Gammaproteobacteria bacterium]|nr:hypothetical protein [Gammaproteobacteria bacterium]MEC8012074.1 hypothetical protein [Pseudomonadota bacterium]HBF07106.1 hypothetical protein [Gammaproteobacteria bacterium]HCK91929.1 hypothetical protein [Gammaproteobacteria bacterium]|tara:strand:+ start:2018 stop:2632 length:615 start_codon:yes stop_codon:yes gene_type:complete